MDFCFAKFTYSCYCAFGDFFFFFVASSYLVQLNLCASCEPKLGILSFREDLYLLFLEASIGVLLTQDLFSLYGRSILICISQIQLPHLVAFTKHRHRSPVLILELTLRLTPDFLFSLLTPPTSVSSCYFFTIFLCFPFEFSLTSLCSPCFNKLVVVVYLGLVCAQSSFLPKYDIPDLFHLQQQTRPSGHLCSRRVFEHSRHAGLCTRCYRE